MDSDARGLTLDNQCPSRSHRLTSGNVVSLTTSRREGIPTRDRPVTGEVVRSQRSGPRSIITRSEHARHRPGTARMRAADRPIMLDRLSVHGCHLPPVDGRPEASVWRSSSVRGASRRNHSSSRLAVLVGRCCSRSGRSVAPLESQANVVGRRRRLPTAAQSCSVTGPLLLHHKP